MTEEDIKHILYGSIKELVNNRYYYQAGYYGCWTSQGQKVLLEIMSMYASKITDAISRADDERAKMMVLDKLKEENK